MDYQIPDQYVLGQPFAASVTYSLPENDYQPSELGSAQLSVSGVDEVLAASTYVPASSLQPEKNPVGIAVAAAAAVMALVLGMRLWRKAGKKKPAATGPAQWEIITRKPLPAEPPPWEKETDKASPRSQTKPPSRD